jgi:hypothetical protein
VVLLLDKQISIISTDTAGFYSNREEYLHKLNHLVRAERSILVNGGYTKNTDGKIKRRIIGLKEIEKQLHDYGISDEDLKLILKCEYDYSKLDENSEKISELGEQYCYYKTIISIKNKKIKEIKERLLKLLANKVEANIQSNGKHHIRTLRDNQVSTKNIVSVFDSFFTRTIGAKEDELCEDFMIVQVYFFSIIQDLIYHGFMYKGEKYIYFTSSAGQIRTKKTVFVKESVWKKYEKTIMCGLTIDEINKRGGNNPNKHLAYLALNNSATDVWEEFDIDKTIVIDDFETDVLGTYDLIDDTDYSIKRTTGYVPIPHTDGCGMILPNAFGVKQKNKMIRLPWVKGLLGVFDYVKFIEVNNCSPIIKDIYGVEHNIIKEDIQVIFTKSQFKSYKHYDSWEQYKEYYKQYGCSVGFTNPEEDRIKNAAINYQMLQSLTDITDDEILKIAEASIDKLNNISSSVKNIQEAFATSAYSIDKTAFQKSIELYPDLLNDEYVKCQLREIKDSTIKKYKSGKLRVHGKYTFVLPDLYAACEYWFKGVENPNGLLNDGEVFCWLFRKDEKLDCLRSPHLYCEHAIRKNIACNENDKQQDLRKWFCTSGIYTSCKDMISKILQLDVDGDTLLVVADKTLIEVAERNIKKYNIVPLYYNMKKAESRELNSQTLYNGLNAAFTGGNIGIYSNNISKIWNSDVFISGTDKEKREAIDIIKLLCCENNFTIDYAKTLYKPERPKFAKELIAKYTKDNLPNFFKFAKDKEENQISQINNSFVNKLNYIIPNPRINCRRLGLSKIDYTLLMNNPDIECKVEFTTKGKIIKEETDPLIIKYCELSKKYSYAIKNAKNIDKSFSYEILKKSKLRQDLKYKKIYSEIKKELSCFGYSEMEISDILVKFLYGIKESKHKMILWLCYGDYIYENLQKHLKPTFKDVQCVDCGEWFRVKIRDNNTCRCPECVVEHRRELTRLRVKKHRDKKCNGV